MPFFAFSQRAIFLEIGGNSGLAAVNYEKVFKEKPGLEFNYRLGFTVLPNSDRTSFIFPVMINIIKGRGNHKLDFGLGQGLTIASDLNAYLRGLINIGYRYQVEDKRLFLRVNYTPFISYLFDLQYEHWAGLSIGYKLKEKQSEK